LKSGLVVFGVLSVSRILALHLYYRAPIGLFQQAYPQLSEKPLELKREAVLCLGNEWYRFPSHFFFPPGIRISFIREDFHGLLPKYFYQDPVRRNESLSLLKQGDLKGYWNVMSQSPRYTDLEVDGMNDLNLEELDRYVSLFF
jgi:alpha-1,2-mannosyltransferase